MDQMLMNYDKRRMRVAFLQVVSLVIVSCFASQVHAQDRELVFEARHRVSAHACEFNGLVLSADAQRLFVATEKGQTLIWNIAADRVEQTLSQPGPVHYIAALAGAQAFVTAGSVHYEPRNAVVRKWDGKTGSYVDLDGVAKNAFPVTLVTEPKLGLIAVTTLDGAIHVWDATTNKQIATWNIKDFPAHAAIVGRNVYVLTIDRKSALSDEPPAETTVIRFNIDEPQAGSVEFLRSPDRRLMELEVTPDYRGLIVTYDRSEEEDMKTVVIDPVSKAEIAILPRGNLAWIDSTKAIVFDWKEPEQIAQIQTDGTVATEKLERIERSREESLFGLSGRVANAAGTKVWATYSKTGGLVEFDLAAKKFRLLVSERPGAYSASVDSVDGEEGLLLTGGADGYVRLWKLSDVSLMKEYRPLGPGYFIRDAILLPGAGQAVVGAMKVPKSREEAFQTPVQVLLLDLESGQHKKLDEAYLWRSSIAVVGNQIVLPEGDRIKFVAINTGEVTREIRLESPILKSDVSENGRWLAAVDEAKKLTVVNLTTFKKKRVAFKPEDAGPLAVTNDGRYVSLVAHGGRFLTFDMKTSKLTETVLKEIREASSNVDFMTLANDDKWIVATGNHGEVAIYDRKTMRLVSYVRTSAAALYVETVWIRGDRVIFTTDTGVVFDGRLR